MSETRFGNFDDLLEKSEDSQKATLISLRKLILSIHPDAFEVVRLGERSATYGVGPKKNIEAYAYLLPHKNWINIGFLQGVNLPDPGGLLEGSGKKMRHVKIRSREDVDNPDLLKLIESAFVERQSALGK
jgi:hypothetical protein